MYLARIGRSVTKWIQACDRRLARLISYIHFTSDYRQYCHVGNAAQHCRLGLFQDSDFAGDLEESKSTSSGVLFIFESRTFVPISWVCKKQTSVSHSSTESEIISLDVVCVWMVYLHSTCGIWSLKCWERLKEYQNQPKRAHRKPGVEIQSTPKIKRVLDQNVDLSNMDQVPSNAHLSEKELQLYIFEDNEAVIKMIIKGRSPTMRHVSRTQ